MPDRPECKQAAVFYGVTLWWCAEHDHLIVMSSNSSTAKVKPAVVEAVNDLTIAVRSILERHSLIKRSSDA